MSQRPADRLAMAMAQLNPIVGDIAGNPDKRPQARARGRARWRRPRRILRNCSSPAIRRRIWCSSRRSRRPAARAVEDAGARNRRRRPGGADRHALGGGRQALQCRMRCSTGGRIEALRFKVDLPNYGVFDEKRVFAAGPAARARSASAACASACRSARTSGATTRTSSNAWPRPAPRFSWCRTARPIGATRSTCGSTSRSRASRGGAAAHLRQPGRRPGRIGVRRRLVRRSTPTARSRCSCRRSAKRWR